MDDRSLRRGNPIDSAVDWQASPQPANRIPTASLATGDPLIHCLGNYDVPFPPPSLKSHEIESKAKAVAD